MEPTAPPPEQPPAPVQPDASPAAPASGGLIETGPPVRKSHRLLWGIAGLVVLIAAASVYLVLSRDKTPPPTNQAALKSAAPANTGQTLPYLVFYDDNAKTVSMTDKTGKLLYKTAMPKADFYDYTSASPDKQLLLSAYDEASNTSSYVWLDSRGTIQTINPTAQKLMQDSNASTLSIKFIGSGAVVTASCTPATGHNNSCVLSKLDLATGTSQPLLKAKATLPAYATGESLLDMIGLSQDAKQLYLYVGGPSSLGNQQNAVFGLDLATLKLTKLYELPANRSGDNMAISSDDKHLVYDDVTGPTDSKIYTVDLANNQEKSSDWQYSLVSNGYTFSWSPDNSKVLVVGSSFTTGGNVGLAVIDAASGQLTNLQTIANSALKQVQHLYWLDDRTAVYGLETTTTSNDFRGSTSSIYTVDTSTKTVSGFKAPPGYLIDAIWQ